MEGESEGEEEAEEGRLREWGVEERKRQEMGYCESRMSKLVKGRKREGARGRRGRGGSTGAKVRREGG